MKNKKIMFTGLAAVLIAALFIAVNAQNGQHGGNDLQGSWKVRLTSAQPGPPPFDAMMTFSDGGGLIESNNLFPAAGASPGHGTWQYNGRREFSFYGGRSQYSFTYIKFLFNPQTHQFTGTIKISGTIFNVRQNTWEGSAHVEIMDPAGNVVQTGYTTGTASRINADS